MQDAAIIAANTADAYSADRYGPTEWQACAQELLDRGCTQPETEAFLRSKHMRWAGDYGEDLDVGVTAEALRRYLQRQMPTRAQLLSEARNLAETS